MCLINVGVAQCVALSLVVGVFIVGLILGVFLTALNPLNKQNLLGKVCVAQS